MTFSFAGRGDEKTIAGICGDFADRWNEEQFRSAFALDNFYCLLASGERAAGFIAWSETADDADIEMICVSFAERRKGVGTALLKEAEEQMRSRKIKKVFLEVRADNAPALSLYRGAGYEQISERKKYYRDGGDALVMVKELL